MVWYAIINWERFSTSEHENEIESTYWHTAQLQKTSKCIEKHFRKQKCNEMNEWEVALRTQ